MTAKVKEAQRLAFDCLLNEGQGVRKLYYGWAISTICKGKEDLSVTPVASMVKDLFVDILYAHDVIKFSKEGLRLSLCEMMIKVKFMVRV